MDRWSELERLAKAATPKRWHSFGGDTTHAVICSRTGREVVAWAGFDSSRTARTHPRRAALADFISAGDPKTILALIEAARQPSPKAGEGEG